MTLFGIDAQARLTRWDNIARSGAKFAIFRCVGEGGVIDPDYAGNVRDAEANGLIAGGYHFIANGTSVEHCRRFVGAMGDPRGRLVVVDVERPRSHPAPTINDVRRWFDEYRKNHPYQPVILYSGKWWWAGPQFGNPMGADLTPHLWSSRYVTGPYPGNSSILWDSPYGGWSKWTLWQYRGSGNLADGSSAGGAVDLNAYRGTLAQLRLLTRPNTATGDTVSVYTRTERRGTLTIAAGTTVRGWKMGPAGPEEAKRLTPTATTSAPFRATLARISGSASPSSLLEVSDGYFAGLYVSTAEVAEEYAPVVSVAGFAERLRADLPAFIDQKVKEYGA